MTVDDEIDSNRQLKTFFKNCTSYNIFLFEVSFSVIAVILLLDSIYKTQNIILRHKMYRHFLLLKILSTLSERISLAAPPSQNIFIVTCHTGLIKTEVYNICN